MAAFGSSLGSSTIRRFPDCVGTPSAPIRVEGTGTVQAAHHDGVDGRGVLYVTPSSDDLAAGGVESVDVCGPRGVDNCRSSSLR